MPRITRAALRSQETQEVSNMAASIPLPLTPIKGRVPLGETAGNVGLAPATEVEEDDATKKATKKGKKGHAVKKAPKKKTAKATKQDVEVMEDDDQSATSSAAEEASINLLKDDDDPELVSVCNHRPCTPSAAVQEINHQISPTAKTPHFDPDIHKPVTTAGDDGKTEKEDSFVANIESRTPAKMTESIPIASLSITRSDETPPLAHGSPSRRIEDSVAALDALEEEIEKVGSLIPKISDLEHPAPLKKQTKPSSKPRKLERSKGTSCALDKTHSALRNKPSVTASSKAPRAPSQATKMSPRHGKSPNQNPAATLPSATISRPKTMSQDGHKPRVSSIHKTPFQPTKSTKPPTKSTFELPGEAVSRRLKEQREERQSAQEDPEPKKHTFKARPNPLRQSQAPEVKLTAATRARLSIAAGKGAPRTSNVHEKAKSNPISMGTINANKRTSSIYIPKRSSIPPTQKAPNQRASSITGSLANRTSSSSNAPPPTSEDLAHQKVKGKEVFGRARAQIQEREKARKEKEEAAKKARAEAAERGRIASREWAEKQKARQMGEKKAGQQAKTEGN